MAHPVPLNNVDHGHVHIAPGFGARFGDAVNQTLVFPTEFEDLQREYAILFRRNEENRFRSVILLGLDRDENLFLDGARWDAHYVPALHARGPFSISVPTDPGVDPTVHIDTDHPRLSTTAGDPIFREHGGNGPVLERALAALQRAYVGSKMSEAMFPLFDELGLLAPVTLQLDLDESRRYNVPDCYTVDGARLDALDGAALERLQREGFLKPALWVSSSLANVRRLLDRKLRRDARA
jgi:hypothetical protein